MLTAKASSTITLLQCRTNKKHFFATAYAVRDGRLYFHFVCQSTFDLIATCSELQCQVPEWPFCCSLIIVKRSVYLLRSRRRTFLLLCMFVHTGVKGYPGQVRTRTGGGGTPARSGWGYTRWGSPPARDGVPAPTRDGVAQSPLG